MKRLVLAGALVGCGLLTLQGVAHAHGGQYRGPGDTVPPGAGGGGGGVGGGVGPAGPSAPVTGPGLPTTPGVGPGGTPGGTPAGTAGTTDASGGATPTAWTFWWEFNKDPYLRLKAHIHSAGPATGDAGFFLGNGTRRSAERLAPSERQIRDEVVPALLAALENETNNDIVTGCLVALAKIGDAPSETGDSPFERVILPFLADDNLEIAETAAVALGILSSPSSIAVLEDLALDTSDGRARTGRPAVPERTRAFAAYGLGLIGARASDDAQRARIVDVLHGTLEGEPGASRDLPVACVIALGLTPLFAPAADPADDSPTLRSREEQLDYVLALLRDEDRHALVRAHAPTALARLLEGLPEELHAAWRERVAEGLLEVLEPRRRERDELVQSAVLALGAIATCDDGSPLDRRIRRTLVDAPKSLRDQQARYFALIALARLGGNVPAGPHDGQPTRDEIARVLLDALADGKSGARPWAALACGVFAEALARTGQHSPRLDALQHAVRATLGEAKDPELLGALAVAAGVMKDLEARAAVVEVLERRREDDTRGYAAIGLGLMGAREEIEAIQRVVADAKYRPELLKQAAIGLGLLGDKQLVPRLVEMLGEARGMATQASISTALGFIGDRDAIAPLTRLLADTDKTTTARAFAAVALGIVGDKEPLPWNSKIGLGLNYRAKTTTLYEPSTGNGILDML